MITLVIIVIYMCLLLGLGVLSNRYFTGSSKDFFLASHSIGPVMLLMSIFGTTMTAFALVGSTGEAFNGGIGVYGMMASWSALVHAGVFFLVGIRLWAFGKRYGYVTQIQFFRDRYESDLLGLMFFPVLVGLVIPYLLMGLLGAGMVMNVLTQGLFPEAFAETHGGLPPWLTSLVICGVVLTYVFFGGLRGAAWANTFQTSVFIVMGMVAFFLISAKLGGPAAATQAVLNSPENAKLLARGGEGQVGHLQFMSYALIPASVGMFPHVFQHWLTARSAKAFRLTVIAHPLFILIVWTPCILIGVWATSALMPDGSPAVPGAHPPNSELAFMVKNMTNPVMAGFLGAGILAAIMSSLDSQFLCLGTVFTHDIVLHYIRRDRLSDKAEVLCARAFIILIVAITFVFSLFEPRHVFTLGVWCFSGFTALFPILFAALYWKRVTKAGAMAALIVTAVVWLVMFRAGDYGSNRQYLFLDMMPVATITACSTITLVIVSLLTKPPSEATIKKFFPS